MSILRSTAIATTARAERYIKQLCKHFGHRVPAKVENGEGRIEFPFGVADLQATGTSLRLSLGAANLDDLKRLQKIIEDHLVRFAFREKLSGLDWNPQL